LVLFWDGSRLAEGGRTAGTKISVEIESRDLLKPRGAGLFSGARGSKKNGRRIAAKTGRALNDDMCQNDRDLLRGSCAAKLFDECGRSTFETSRTSG
jgi:hypothetical protein